MALDVTVIRQQLQNFVAQRDHSANTFQQCVGAIAILEEQLQVIALEEMKKKEEGEKLEQECLKTEKKKALESSDNVAMN